MRSVNSLCRWYGAGPLHLVALVASFAVAGFAALRLLPGDPVGIVVWFVGAAVGHDLLLLPLYALIDGAAQAVLAHRPLTVSGGTWINFVRVPAVLSGLLLLVWFPLIARMPARYHGITDLSASPYLARWLLITAALFAFSAVLLTLRLRRSVRSSGT